MATANFVSGPWRIARPLSRLRVTATIMIDAKYSEHCVYLLNKNATKSKNKKQPFTKISNFN